MLVVILSEMLTATNDECVILVDRTISFQEVRLQINIEQVSEIMKFGN